MGGYGMGGVQRLGDGEKGGGVIHLCAGARDSPGVFSFW